MKYRPEEQMLNSNLKILIKSGWREDRNEEESLAYSDMILTCSDAGFTLSNSIADILRQVFGLRISMDSGFVSFEHPEYYVDTYPKLKEWMDKNVNIFPIGDYNGDPLFIDSDQNLYLSNYDVLVMGMGGFFKSLSDIFSSDFFSSKNFISLLSLPD